MVELISLKLCEVFAESIPCTMIQVIAVLRDANSDMMLVVSVVVSAMFTAESVVWMTYIVDLKADQR